MRGIDKTVILVAATFLLLTTTITIQNQNDQERLLQERRALAQVTPAPTPTPTPVPTPEPTPEPTPVPTPHVHTPKPKPATTPHVHPPAPAISYEPGSVKARIVAAWPGDDAKVLRVISCETGGTFNPAIVSKSGKYHGLLQADAAFWKAYGGHAYAPKASQASVEGQIAVMWRGFQARGWQPWPVCGKK